MGARHGSAAQAQRDPTGPAFDAVITRATAKDPAERFGSAGEMATALRAAVAEHQEHVHRLASQETGGDEEGLQATEFFINSPPVRQDPPAPAGPPPAAASPVGAGRARRPRRR